MLGNRFSPSQSTTSIDYIVQPLVTSLSTMFVEDPETSTIAHFTTNTPVLFFSAATTDFSPETTVDLEGFTSGEQQRQSVRIAVSPQQRGRPT